MPQALGSIADTVGAALSRRRSGDRRSGDRDAQPARLRGRRRPAARGLRSGRQPSVDDLGRARRRRESNGDGSCADCGSEEARDELAAGHTFFEDYSQRELRDDRVLFFVDHMAAGMYHYRYLARATSLGKFVLPSTRVRGDVHARDLRPQRGQPGERGMSRKKWLIWGLALPCLLLSAGARAVRRSRRAAERAR